MPASGRYYPDVLNGNMFIGSTATAGVKPGIVGATAHKYAIWNPLGSGKNIIPISIDIGYVDTTSAAGNIGFDYQTGVGAQIATGGPITAITQVAPLNALLSGGASSVAKFAPATITFAAATTFLMTFGFSQLVTTAATTSSIGWHWQYNFEGKLVIPPGVAVAVSGAAAPLSNLNITTFWIEAPIGG